jgi:hypothetical protein
MIGLPTRKRMLDVHQYIVDQEDAWIWSVSKISEPK